jgi:hypothetical protein
MGGAWPEIAAWFGLPVVLFATGAGVGLLVERLCRVELPGPLVAPLGVCAGIVLLMPLAYAGVGSGPCAVVLLVATLAGPLLQRREWRSQLRRISGGWAGVAGVAVFGLYMAPAALTGHWTWTGYNLVNDTAFQFLLTDWVRDHGIPYQEQARSTTSEVVRVYLASHYPIGSHVHLATLATIVRVPAEVVYASYLCGVVALAAMASAALVRRASAGARWAAAAGFVAVSASLTYHYALQGNIKEMAMLLALVVAAAAGRELLATRHPLRAAIPFGVAIAACVAVYYAAALPYVAALGGAVLLAAFVQPEAEAVRRRIVPAVAVATATVLLLSLPVLSVLADSFRVLQGTFSNPGTASANVVLGHLARQLPLYEVGGIWLDGDYRVPVLGTAARGLTAAGLVLVFALAAAAIASGARRRESGAIILLAAGVATYVVVAPRTSPYADAKMLALLAPAVVLCAMVGAAALSRVSRWLGVACGAVLGILVLGSAAFAYHDVRLAPMDRIADLRDLGERYAGSERLMLFNEFEEYAKYFMRDSVINVPTEAMTESFIELRAGGDFPSRSFDLDEITLAYVQRFPAIIVRRQPTSSRPPANYRFEYRNASYEVWRQTARGQVLDHLPIQAADSAYAEPRCRDLRAFARTAPRDAALVAATGPETATFDFFRQQRRPADWVGDPIRPGDLLLGTPGRSSGVVDVHGGEYRAWVEGTFGRPMYVSVDGRRIGAAEGVNTPRAWLPAGSVRLSPGRHTIEVRRPPGNLEPGDGARSSLGAVALTGAGARKLVRVPPSRAQELCGRPLDWVEIVRSAAY